jgi:hypothetical protein
MWVTMTFQFTLNDSQRAGGDCFDGKGTEIGVLGPLLPIPGLGWRGWLSWGWRGRLERTVPWYLILIGGSLALSYTCKLDIATDYLRPPPVL